MSTPNTVVFASARSVKSAERLHELQKAFSGRLHLISMDVVDSSSIQVHVHVVYASATSYFLHLAWKNLTGYIALALSDRAVQHCGMHKPNTLGCCCLSESQSLCDKATQLQQSHSARVLCRQQCRLLQKSPARVVWTTWSTMLAQLDRLCPLMKSINLSSTLISLRQQHCNQLVPCAARPSFAFKSTFLVSLLVWSKVTCIP